MDNYLIYLFIGILALFIGSFLNVVIYRIPKMLEYSWLTQCIEYLKTTKPDYLTPNAVLKEDKTYNLLLPASSCPNCDTKIKFWQNIPILSYLFLFGKCGFCKNPISIRYPIIELITLILSLILLYKFGLNLKLLFSLIFTWGLIALTMIDLDQQILPDDITIPGIWLGLAINTQNIFCTLQSSVMGAIIGYLSLWGFYWIFKFITKKEGMGYGDFKLLAMLGAWLGLQALPYIILLSSLMGSIIGIILILFFKHHKNKPIAFGPYLCVAGWVYLLIKNSLYF